MKFVCSLRGHYFPSKSGVQERAGHNICVWTIDAVQSLLFEREDVTFSFAAPSFSTLL
jgi:hypothetical protein